MRLMFTDLGHTFQRHRKQGTVESQIGYPEKIHGKKVLHPVWITKIECSETKFLAFAMKSQITDDVDGAPTAYGRDRQGKPLQQGLHPLDHLANATTPYTEFPHGKYAWCGVVAATKAYAEKNKLEIDDRFCAQVYSKDYLALDRADAELGAYPVVQTTGATKGYYISKTDKVREGSITDPGIYANPLVLPMMVRTGTWEHEGARKGDYGWALRKDYLMASSFAFGDGNGSSHVGEISRALNVALGKPVDALFLIFPRSGRGRELMGMECGTMSTGVRTEFAKLIGVENRLDLLAFLACGADMAKFKALRSGQVSGTNASDVQSDYDALQKSYPALLLAAAAAGFPLPNK